MTQQMNDIPAGMQMMMGAFLIANKPYFQDEVFDMGMNHYARTCVDPTYRETNHDDRVIGPFTVVRLSRNYQENHTVTYPIPGSEYNWSFDAARAYARQLCHKFNGVYAYGLLNYADNICIGWRFDVSANNIFEIDLNTGEIK